MHIVGLPDAEVREAKDRVRAALHHARFEFPARRITVDLAPADLPKASSRFDLPIALGILAGTGQSQAGALTWHEFAGELAQCVVPCLWPSGQGMRGARSCCSARAASAAQAALAARACVLSAKSLLEVRAHLNGAAPLAEHRGGARRAALVYAGLLDVKGQAHAGRRQLSCPVVSAMRASGRLELCFPGFSCCKAS
ncbi:MAG TPA: magnesium chelatase domain-containing protein [Burkholderiales bacterium]|nr:magnesium chelatase domain-containing protein [Burkholderiales bacterium]